jgi:nicotinic acetylcholine receptor
MTVSFRYVCGRPIILRHFSEPKIQVYPFVFAESLQGPHEKRLLHTLLDHYNVLERPVMNESDPLQLSFGLTLMQIIDVVSSV